MLHFDKAMRIVRSPLGCDFVRLCIAVVQHKAGLSPFQRMLQYARVTALLLLRPAKALTQFEIFLLFGLSDTRWPDQEAVE